MKLVVNFLFVMLFVMISISVQAQEFVFDYQELELEEVENELASSNHPFGSEFTVMMQLLREKYTYEEKNTIQQTTSTIVEKPSIYYSTRKANQHLVKAAKKGLMSREEAEKELKSLLVIALNIRYQNTTDLEQKLNTLKKPESITAFYSEAVSLDR